MFSLNKICEFSILSVFFAVIIFFTCNLLCILVGFLLSFLFLVSKLKVEVKKNVRITWITKRWSKYILSILLFRVMIFYMSYSDFLCIKMECENSKKKIPFEQIILWMLYSTFFFIHSSYKDIWMELTVQRWTSISLLKSHHKLMILIQVESYSWGKYLNEGKIINVRESVFSYFGIFFYLSDIKLPVLHI